MITTPLDMEMVHVVLLGHGPDVDVMTGVLSSSREWEVSNHVVEGGLVDVIVIAGEDRTDSSQIIAYNDWCSHHTVATGLRCIHIDYCPPERLRG